MKASQIDVTNFRVDEMKSQERNDLLRILENGKPTSRHLLFLFTLINADEKLTKNPTSEAEKFYKNVNSIGKKYVNSPDGKKEQKDGKKASQSFYAIFNDDSLSAGEKIKKI
jgi:hypothetical protein